MNNLFLVGDSFSSKTYIFELEYLLNEKFDSIYLLGESNKEEDIFVGCTSPVNITNDVDVCLSNCHTVFIIYTAKFTDEMLLKSIDPCKLYGKRIYKINTIDNNSEGTITKHTIQHYNSKPTVLVFNYSRHTQCHIIELALNKYFVKEGLNLYQVFSSNSSAILRQLQNISLLNPSIYRTLEDIQDTDLNVKTIDLFDDNSLINIAHINPVYTILVTESDISQAVDDIFKAFYMRYGLSLNAIVKSQFAALKLWYTRTELLYKGNIEINLSNGTSSQSKDAISDILLNDLINNISLPDTIDRIELDIKK